MLVLSRKRHERLIIASGEIVIAVDDIDRERGGVTLSVHAGRHAIMPVIWGGQKYTDAFPADAPAVSRSADLRRIPRVLPGMRVLDCLEQDLLLIGREVRLHVLAPRGNSARFGIEAAVDIPVHREEIYDSIRRGERSA